MKKTVIYVRQSLDTDKQPHSTSMQLDMALEYAKNNEWIIHETYNEGKRSARKTRIEDRAVLNRLLNDIQSNKIGRVLVFKRDRLARNVQQYIQIYRLFKKHGVELHFTADNEPPLFEGAASEFIEAIMAGIGEYEANNLVQRLIYSKVPLIKKGFWMAGSVPFAYEPIKKNGKEKVDYKKLSKENRSNLKVITKNAEIVKEVYRTVISLPEAILASRDFSRVCKSIRENKVLQDLKNKQIYDIITQRLHIGKMLQRLDGEEYPVNLPNTQSLRILDESEEEIWYRANDIINKMDLPTNLRKKLTEEGFEEEISDPLLLGVIFCGTCRKAMVATKKSYKCSTGNCKNAPRINTVNSEVFQKVWTHLMDRGMHEWNKVLKNLDVRYAEPFFNKAKHVQKEIQEVEKEIKELFQIHLNADSVESRNRLSETVSKYKAMTLEAEKLESLYFHTSKFVQSLNKEDMLKVLDDIDFTEVHKKHLLTLVNRVYYHKKITELKCFVAEVKNEKKEKTTNC
ncbi:recombinase family protein [Fictibacillus fluitans]|uniref:Recombinase family protein n=1 Tax=Fictibacillus fluitans TaxID=3058422 RepID=A0ABT8HXJ7_9BACL|nr:recombinase family protein [Fictibacillus sp. NE201]MDN4525505.1 recombinase family protein [Fictibacillus sp. NE201]